MFKKWVGKNFRDINIFGLKTKIPPEMNDSISVRNEVVTIWFFSTHVFEIYNKAKNSKNSFTNQRTIRPIIWGFHSLKGKDDKIPELNYCICCKHADIPQWFSSLLLHLYKHQVGAKANCHK